MSDNVTEKEIYRLWWEYLKRSEHFIIFYNWAEKHFNHIKIEEPEIIESLDPLTMGRLTGTYLTFREIRTKPFDEWWKSAKSEIKGQRKFFADVAVRNYIKEFESDFKICIDKFKDAERREPSLNEFKDFYIRWLKETPCHLILSVDLAQHKIDVLRNAFNQLIRNKKKDPTIKLWEKQLQDTHSQTGRVRYDELKRYLTVYDLRKDGMKYDDIIKKIGEKSQKEHCYDPDIQRQFRRDFKNAKQIIKNAVIGKFPLMSELPKCKYPFPE